MTTIQARYNGKGEEAVVLQISKCEIGLERTCDYLAKVKREKIWNQRLVPPFNFGMKRLKMEIFGLSQMKRRTKRWTAHWLPLRRKIPLLLPQSTKLILQFIGNGCHRLTPQSLLVRMQVVRLYNRHQATGIMKVNISIF